MEHSTRCSVSKSVLEGVWVKRRQPFQISVYLYRIFTSLYIVGSQSASVDLILGLKMKLKRSSLRLFSFALSLAFPCDKFN